MPKGPSVIGTKWMFRNKLDESWKIFRNKHIKKNGILILQEKYAKELLKKSNKDRDKRINTLMHPSQVLEADKDREKVSDELYKELKRKIQVATATFLQIFMLKMYEKASTGGFQFELYRDPYLV